MNEAAEAHLTRRISPPVRVGSRIEVPFGGGYHDAVSDDDIRSHLERGLREGDVRAAVNAAATLALREWERREK